MTVDAKNPILAIISITLMTSSWTGEVTATSQFLNDASFSIVDTELSSVTPEFRIGIWPTPKPTKAPMTKRTVSPPSSRTVSPSSSSTVSPSSSSTVSPLLQNYNPLSGFNRPVMLRGDDSLDTTTGIFYIDDDGYYVFVIHRLGVDFTNPDLILTRIPIADTTTNETLATMEDIGEGRLVTTHVVAELNRGDRVLIANPLRANVVGTEDNPFIYNAFLLYHTPITSTPNVRQSAFSVTVNGNTSIAGEAFIDYDYPPAVDINDDFDTESGTFSTSVKGLYIFHLSVTFTFSVPLGDRPAVAITINDVERVRVLAHIDMTRPIQNAGVTIALPMVKGDIVQLRNVFETPDIECFATFVGYLLA